MINQLRRIIVETEEDGTQVTKLPSNEEMMNKINEIIRYINKEEDRRFRERINGFGIRKG